MSETNKYRTLYMHTIDRKAATWDGKNVVLCYRGVGQFVPAKLYRSLRTLTAHIAKSGGLKGVQHGWVEVEVPS